MLADFYMAFLRYLFTCKENFLTETFGCKLNQEATKKISLLRPICLVKTRYVTLLMYGLFNGEVFWAVQREQYIFPKSAKKMV